MDEKCAICENGHDLTLTAITISFCGAITSSRQEWRCPKHTLTLDRLLGGITAFKREMDEAGVACVVTM